MLKWFEGDELKEIHLEYLGYCGAVLYETGAAAPAPNKILIHKGRHDSKGIIVEFWTDDEAGWTSERCPYTDIEEVKVWAKREYLLHYAKEC